MTVYWAVVGGFGLVVLTAIYGAIGRVADALEAAADPVVVEQTIHAAPERLGDELDRIRDCGDPR